MTILPNYNFKTQRGIDNLFADLRELLPNEDNLARILEELAVHIQTVTDEADANSLENDMDALRAELEEAEDEIATLKEQVEELKLKGENGSDS